jgi:hypothetical protein
LKATVLALTKPIITQLGSATEGDASLAIICLAFAMSSLARASGMSRTRMQQAVDITWRITDDVPVKH